MPIPPWGAAPFSPTPWKGSQDAAGFDLKNLRHLQPGGTGPTVTAIAGGISLAVLGSSDMTGTVQIIVGGSAIAAATNLLKITLGTALVTPTSFCQVFHLGFGNNVAPSPVLLGFLGDVSFGSKVQAFFNMYNGQSLLANTTYTVGWTLFGA